MTETTHNDLTEQFADRLVDIMLEEGVGDRPTPDLRDAIIHSVTHNRRSERVTLLAIAAGIAVILALLTPRLLRHRDEPATDNIARQHPRPVPETGTPPIPHPAAGHPVPPIPERHVAEASRWPPPVLATGTTPILPTTTLSKVRWKELPVIEALLLAQADREFGIRRYRSAADSYDSFVAAYPRSAAIPYALLKKGRAAQLDDKRFQAIKTYEEILDYYPSSIEFAAPALFHIGQCYQQNGNEEKAHKAWLEMVTDKDYKKHPLAACAANNLADTLWRQGKPDQALSYYRDVVRESRRTAPDAGLHALQQVARYYVLIEPNEQKLREWYREAGTFHPDPRTIDADTDLAHVDAYWQATIQLVREGTSSYPEAQAHLRRQCADYWIDALDTGMPRKEELLMALADLRREHTGDTAGWVREMDAIFASNHKPDDTERVIRWLAYYRELPDQAARYCAMIDPNGKAVALLDDGAKARLAQRLGVYDAEAALKIISGIVDKVTRLTTLVDYYHALGPSAGAEKLPLNLDRTALPAERIRTADELAQIEGQARHALWMKAQFLHWNKQYAEAIACYRMADNPPDSLWCIVECHKALGDWEQAIRQLAEIEHFFKDQAPKAAFMQAEIHALAGRKNQQIATLRRVMKTYRLAAQATMAHQQLEHLSVPIGGGADADEEKKENNQ